MAKRSKKEAIDPTKSVRDQYYPKGRKRRLVIRVQIDFLKSGKVARYALSLVDLHSGLDNGRVLGYDNTHGRHHRHCQGKEEPVEFISYEDIQKRFEEEVQRYIESGEI